MQSLQGNSAVTEKKRILFLEPLGFLCQRTPLLKATLVPILSIWVSIGKKTHSNRLTGYKETPIQRTDGNEMLICTHVRKIYRMEHPMEPLWL